MPEEPPHAHTPEARSRHGMRDRLASLGIGERFVEVSKRVAIGTYEDGFLHAGNLAYLALMTLFTGMIIGPVKRIERMINRLGEGRELGN